MRGFTNPRGSGFLLDLATGYRLVTVGSQSLRGFEPIRFGFGGSFAVRRIAHFDLLMTIGLGYFTDSDLPGGAGLHTTAGLSLGGHLDL